MWCCSKKTSDSTANASCAPATSSCTCRALLLDLAALCSRLSLGLLLCIVGWHKIQGGIDNFYEKNFLSLKPTWLPDFFAWPYGHAVPFLEVGLGTLLILGLLTRFAGLASALIIGSFTLALWNADKLAPQGPQAPPFNLNFIYISLALLIAATGSGRLGLDTFCRSCCCCCKPKSPAA